MQDVLPAVRLSLCVSIAATTLCAVFGIPLGCLIATREFATKRLLLSILNTLLSIPTVVVGLLVYSMICRRSVLGFLDLLYTPPAIIAGQVILALPIMVTFTHAAVASVDKTAAETARTLGADGIVTTMVTISEARLGILAAVAATFGRLIGEVGVSMIVGGNIWGYTRTMTTAIALEASKGEFVTALKLGGILLLIALAVNALLQCLRGESGPGTVESAVKQ